MKKQLKKQIIIILTLLLLIMIIGIIILYAFNLNKYGINFLCSLVGGILCYWPSWILVLEIASFIITLIILLLILFSK